MNLPSDGVRGFAERIITPLALFAAAYFGTALLLSAVIARRGMSARQWIALASVTAATLVCVRFWERGSWNLGLRQPARAALLQAVRGAGLAAVLLFVADLLILATAGLRHLRGAGFPASELLAVYVPAAIHEELLFRGYVFQKLLVWQRWAAYGFSGCVFAILHAGNSGISLIALLNLLLAGVLLGRAFEIFRSLWYTTGLHLAWNLLSGPLLGYNVSGYVPRSTLFMTVVQGPVWLSGGSFGIEGSLCTTLAELGGIALLALWTRPASGDLRAG